MQDAMRVVRALASEVCRQATALAGRWPDGVPDVAAAEARLASGVAALDGEPLLDGPELLRIGRAIGAAAEQAGGEVGHTMLAIVARLEMLPHDSLDDLASVALAGAWDTLPRLASRLDLDEYALLSVADYAARPTLVAGAARVRGCIGGGTWSGTTCPACAGAPLLGELSGKDGARTLRCARCGTGWSYARVACALCGERDHRALSALHGEGDGGVRQAECCATCNGYVKSVSVLAPLDYVALLEADLATAGLDLVAVERGYSRRPHA